MAPDSLVARDGLATPMSTPALGKHSSSDMCAEGREVDHLKRLRLAYDAFTRSHSAPSLPMLIPLLLPSGCKKNAGDAVSRTKDAIDEVLHGILSQVVEPGAKNLPRSIKVDDVQSDDLFHVLGRMEALEEGYRHSRPLPLGDGLTHLHGGQTSSPMIAYQASPPVFSEAPTPTVPRALLQPRFIASLSPGPRNLRHPLSPPPPTRLDTLISTSDLTSNPSSFVPT
jgi:hypothetical protein